MNHKHIKTGDDVIPFPEGFTKWDKLILAYGDCTLSQFIAKFDDEYSEQGFHIMLLQHPISNSENGLGRGEFVYDATAWNAKLQAKYVHSYTYTYIHIYTYTHMHIHIYTRIHTYTLTPTLTHTHTHTHTHIYIYIYPGTMLGNRVTWLKCAERCMGRKPCLKALRIFLSLYR